MRKKRNDKNFHPDLFETSDLSVSAIDSDILKIVVWNLCKFSKRNIKTELGSIFSESDPHVFLGQESLWAESWEKYFAELSNFKGLMGNSFLVKKKTPTGVLSLVKSQPISTHFFRSEVREPVSGTPKTIIGTKILWKNLEVLLLNIHAINFVKAKTLKHQLEETQSLLNDHSGPVIYAGDFNTWSGSRLNVVESFMNRNNLSEVAFAAPKKLDKVYCRGVVLTYSKVLHSFRGSDHKPLEVHFKQE